MLIFNQWKKASKSNGNGGNNCVETLLFSKATKSNPSGNCVEVAFNKAALSGAAGHCVEVGFHTAEKSAVSKNCVEVGFTKADKSGYPTGTACVEVGFTKAEASVAERTCVETAQVGVDSQSEDCGCGCDTPLMNGQPIKGAKNGDVIVRDSKQNGDTDQPYLIFTQQEWAEYIHTLMMGYGAIFNGEDAYVIHKDGKALVYTEAEWDAFMDGVRKQEFAYPQELTVV